MPTIAAVMRASISCKASRGVVKIRRGIYKFQIWYCCMSLHVSPRCYSTIPCSPCLAWFSTHDKSQHCPSPEISHTLTLNSFRIYTRWTLTAKISRVGLFYRHISKASGNWTSASRATLPWFRYPQDRAAAESARDCSSLVTFSFLTLFCTMCHISIK